MYDTGTMKDKKQKPKEEKLKINGLIDNPRWKKIACLCSQNPNLVQEIYPIKNCLHCKFQECEDSIPKKCWDMNEAQRDKDGQLTGAFKIRRITEITLVRGQRYDDILGWTF